MYSRSTNFIHLASTVLACKHMKSKELSICASWDINAIVIVHSSIYTTLNSTAGCQQIVSMAEHVKTRCIQWNYATTMKHQYPNDMPGLESPPRPTIEADGAIEKCNLSSSNTELLIRLDSNGYIMTGILKTSSFVLLNGGLDGSRVGADNLLDLFTVLEEQKRGHGADAQLLGDIGALVDVELDELDVRVRPTVLLDLRGDSLARTAPSGVGIDHHELAALNGRVEVGFTRTCQNPNHSPCW